MTDYDLVIPGFPSLISSGVFKCAESLTPNISEPVRRQPTARSAHRAGSPDQDALRVLRMTLAGDLMAQTPEPLMQGRGRRFEQSH